MIKRLILCLAVMAAGAGIFFSARTHGQGGSLQSAPPTPQQAGSLPEYIPYMFLFDHHGSNLRKAAELEQQGKDATFFHTMFKSQLGLTDAESAAFDQVTLDCENDLAQQDAKAQAVISAFRSQFPGGIVPRGQTAPPPPPELTTLQLERNAIILRARDRLHAAFGEREFARFDSYIKRHFAARVQIT